MTTPATSCRASSAARVQAMVREGAIISTSGKRIPVAIDTVCVHGDNPAAVAMAGLVREKLEQAGIALKPMAETIRRAEMLETCCQMAKARSARPMDD